MFHRLQSGVKPDPLLGRYCLTGGGNFIYCAYRPVALMDRAPDSKSGCWGFESLLACHFLLWINYG